jgi:Mrp family chromosome partitioning ATPase
VEQELDGFIGVPRAGFEKASIFVVQSDLILSRIRLFRRWLWLVVVAAALAGGTAFFLSRRQPDFYYAQATLMVGGFTENPNPTAADFTSAVNLAVTYAAIATFDPMLQGTIDELKLDWTTDELAASIDAFVRPGTPLVIIGVYTTNAQLSADIANSLADQLILNSPTNLTEEETNQIVFTQAQIDLLNKQVEDARRQLALLDNRLASAADPDEVDRLEDRRNATIGQINQASATIAQFNATIASIQAKRNRLDIVERARVPVSADNANVRLISLISAIAGAMVAVGAILAIDYLNDTVRTPEEAASTLGLSVLGVIRRFGGRRTPLSEQLVTRKPALSPVLESYRSVQVALMPHDAGDDKPPDIYLVTSPSQNEGKTVTAANLAAAAAATGLKVLLVDANLRQPRLHEIFKVENKTGLTTLLSAFPPDPHILRDEKQGPGKFPPELQQSLHNTDIPNLRVIPSGPVPRDTPQLFGFASLQAWVEILRTCLPVDVILLDTPASLDVADTAIIAAKTGASVILVIDAGRTKRAAALKTREQFIQLGCSIRGIVMNRLNL